MAINLKELGEVIGFNIEDEEKVTVEQIKEHIDEKFVAREHAIKDPKIIDSVFGKTVGSLRTKLKSIGGFDTKEVEGQKIEDLLDKLHEKHSAEVTALKAKGEQSTDKRLTDLQKELEDKTKAVTDYKKALEEKETYIQTKESEFTNTFKTYKVNDKLNRAKSTIHFTEDYHKKEVLKTGFDAMINSKYKFQLDDNENLEVVTVSGERIKHPKKAGEFMKPEELLAFEAEKEGLVKKNNLEKEKKTIFVQSDDEPSKSKVHPNARKNAERQR